MTGEIKRKPVTANLNEDSNAQNLDTELNPVIKLN